MQTLVFLPGRHSPALTLLSVLRLTQTDTAVFIFSPIISFWKYCPQSDPSREGLRSQVSECLNYYLLCEKVNWGRACLTSSHWRGWASLQCASTDQSVQPSVFAVLVWGGVCNFQTLIQPTNTEPANIGCIINEREKEDASFLLFVFTWEYEETFQYL